jgi:hypothetical protein
VRVLALCGLLLAVGCDVAVHEGVVASKRYEPARTWLQPIIVGKVTTLMPHHTDERWIVEIAYQDNDRRWRFHDCEVTRAQYDAAKMDSPRACP